MATITSVPPQHTGGVLEAEPVWLITALADIAARLTAADPTQLVAHDVLERARVVLEAVECSVWVRSTDGLGRMWSAGEEVITAAEVDAILVGRRRSRSTLRIAEMRFGSRSLGALAVRLRNAPVGGVVKFVETLASQLASFIAYSERSRRLEGDLQIRVREVEDQKRFTEAIVDSLPLGLYVIDRDYRITVWNRKRETGMQGISREEAIGRTIFEILHRQPAALLRREFEEVFATGRMQQFQMESKSSGEVRTYRLSKIPMRDESQMVTHIITIGEDITDWVEVRERVSQTEKLAAVGRLAAGVMHEINNPLATIAACAESMTLETTSPEGSPEYLKIIESEVQRCKHIIGGLLDFSRPQPLQRQSLDVNTVAERALFLLKHHARFKQLSVEADLARDLPMVHASSEQLIQVLIALLMNAADAMAQHGRVVLRTRGDAKSARTVTIEVQDEGSGIPRSQMARIFEPFYTTKEQGRGTGLGLAICYGIVAEHDGRIEVESDPGRGSTFRIVLPMEGA
jgi:two-component system NtrC family sensor kinase